MSERRVRLPLAAVDPEELPPIDDALRAPFERPSIAIVSIDRREHEPTLESLRGAASGLGHVIAEIRTTLREGAVAMESGSRGIELAAPLLEMPEALARAEQALPRHALLVASGVGLVAIRRPTVSVLVTRGRAASDWPVDVRSIRHRFELIVPELDATLARELVMRVLPDQRPFSSS